MTKILQINSVVNTGSTGRLVEEIGKKVISKGWQSYIAYGRKSNNSSSKIIKIGNSFDHKIHGLISLMFDNHGLGSYFSTKKFIKEIRRINPDIIHIHNIHGYFLNYKILFEFLNHIKTPIVWTLHDCWAFTGHCSYFSDINCEKWKTLCYECPKIQNYPRSLFLDNSSINYRNKKEIFNKLENVTIVPVSNWLASILKHSFLSNYPINVIYNGVDIEVFKPSSDTEDLRKYYGIPNKKVILGVATSWSKNKGWYDYLELSKILSQDFVIVLIGVSKSQKSLLPKNVIGIERTENLTELATYYTLSEVVLNLSYQETFGMTTVEGFACGTPAIVYDCTASPELISKETGIVVPPGDIVSLKDAIYKINNLGKEYFAQACRERAEMFFNVHSRFEDYIDLYKSILINK